MNDWKAWIREIAYDRIDQIERQLNASPEAFPGFTDAAGKLDAATDETDKHPDAKMTERDDLWMTYSAALAMERYLAGARHGGACQEAGRRERQGVKGSGGVPAGVRGAGGRA